MNSRDDSALAGIAGSLDMILDTVNVELDWDSYLAALCPKGTLHLGAAAPKIEATVFPMISTSPLGSPSTTARMLEFSARHGIAPRTEILPMSEINAAFKKLHDEKPAHRIVLQNDFD